MKYTICGLQQEELVRLGLDATDAVIIQWFADFCHSGKMKEIRIADKSYWWLSYQHVIDDLPISGIKNKEVMGRRFAKYVEAKVFECYVLKSNGTQTFFRISENAWNALTRLESRVRTDSKVESSPDSKVESYPSSIDPPIIDPVCKEIVDDLNSVAGTSFRPKNKSTIGAIEARLREGYSLADFKAVHSVKAAQWKNDPAMAKYLRPETLYRPSHFESYLQEAKASFPHIELDTEEKMFSEDTEIAVERWRALYPGFDVKGFLLDMLEWAQKNPDNLPKDWFLFLDDRIKRIAKGREYARLA